MTTEYSPDKQLIKDFIRWASDTHKCALVQFPNEFSSDRFISYSFVNNGQLIDEFVNDIQRQD